MSRVICGVSVVLLWTSLVLANEIPDEIDYQPYKDALKKATDIHTEKKGDADKKATLYSDAQREHVSLKTDKKNAEETIRVSKQNIDDAEGNIEDLNDRIDALGDEVSDNNDEITRLKNLIDDLTQKISDKQDDIEEQEDAVDEAKKDLSTDEQDLEDAKDLLEQIKEDLKDLVEIKKTAQQNLTFATNRLAQLKQNLEDAKERRDDVTDELSEVATDQRNLKRAIDSLEDEYSRRERLYGDVEFKVEEIQERIDEHLATSTKLKGQLQELNKEITKFETTIEQAESRSKAAQKKIDKANTEIAELKQNEKDLKQKNKELQGKIDANNEIIETKETQKSQAETKRAPLLTDQATLTKRINERQPKIRAAGQDVAKATRAIERLDEQIASKEAEIRTAAREVTRLEGELEKKQNRERPLKREIKQAQDKVNSHEDDMKLLRKQLDRLIDVRGKATLAATNAKKALSANEAAISKLQSELKGPRAEIKRRFDAATALREKNKTLNAQLKQQNGAVKVAKNKLKGLKEYQNTTAPKILKDTEDRLAELKKLNAEHDALIRKPKKTKEEIAKMIELGKGRGKRNVEIIHIEKRYEGPKDGKVATLRWARDNIKNVQKLVQDAQAVVNQATAVRDRTKQTIDKNVAFLQKEWPAIEELREKIAKPTADLKDLKSKTAGLEKKVTDTAKAEKDAIAEQNRVASLIANSEGVLKQKKKTLADLENELKNLPGAIQAAKKAVKTAENNKTKLEGEKGTLVTRRQTKVNERKTASQTKTTLETAQKADQEALDPLEKKIAGFSKTINQAKRAIDRATQENVTTEGAKKANKTIIDSIPGKVAAQNTIVTEQTGIKTKADKRVSDTQDKLDEVLPTRNQKRRAKKKSDDLLAEAKEEMVQPLARLEKLGRDLDEIDDQIETKKFAYRALERRERQLDKLKENITAQIRVLTNRGIPETRDLVATRQREFDRVVASVRTKEGKRDDAVEAVAEAQTEVSNSKFALEKAEDDLETLGDEKELLVTRKTSQIGAKNKVVAANGVLDQKIKEAGNAIERNQVVIRVANASITKSNELLAVLPGKIKTASEAEELAKGVAEKFAQDAETARLAMEAARDEYTPRWKQFVAERKVAVEKASAHALLKIDGKEQNPGQLAGEEYGEDAAQRDGTRAEVKTNGRNAGKADGEQRDYKSGYASGEKDGKEKGTAEAIRVGTKDGTSAGEKRGRTDGLKIAFATGQANGKTEGFADGKELTYTEANREIGRSDGKAAGLARAQEDASKSKDGYPKGKSDALQAIKDAKVKEVEIDNSSEEPPSGGPGGPGESDDFNVSLLKSVGQGLASLWNAVVPNAWALDLDPDLPAVDYKYVDYQLTLKELRHPEIVEAYQAEYNKIYKGEFETFFFKKYNQRYPVIRKDTYDTAYKSTFDLKYEEKRSKGFTDGSKAGWDSVYVTTYNTTKGNVEKTVYGNTKTTFSTNADEIKRGYDTTYGTNKTAGEKEGEKLAKREGFNETEPKAYQANIADEIQNEFNRGAKEVRDLYKNSIQLVAVEAKIVNEEGKGSFSIGDKAYIQVVLKNSGAQGVDPGDLLVEIEDVKGVDFEEFEHGLKALEGAKWEGDDVTPVQATYQKVLEGDVEGGKIFAKVTVSLDGKEIESFEVKGDAEIVSATIASFRVDKAKNVYRNELNFMKDGRLRKGEAIEHQLFVKNMTDRRISGMKYALRSKTDKVWLGNQVWNNGVVRYTKPGEFQELWKTIEPGKWSDAKIIHAWYFDNEKPDVDEVEFNLQIKDSKGRIIHDEDFTRKVIRK